ncbi:MAG: LysM peptidoglycan-binding domain-containing protein [Candidatus Omnitrophica bacterium]|nr:LysM peptidoglycan-binding domain-containing protein [Candidatus Omnitrophota bacterium]MBU2250878.1 LysM peptidoglycan-binding domain-containing protein [Candidatus Omnitrophota bacterium]MBU2265548.1 LysM peptidoglycan-binding domain-containing protein [Candidatus Omnitrophota bacterium]MBU2473883.1 LysM peptidoglycan-binding domain-containing protein [Candidatus Omnitrophota bacterium]
MKKIWLLVSLIFAVGCMTVRTYEVEKPRIDTTVEGNQGFLSGTPKVEPKKSNLSSNRKISVVEIEFGSSQAEASPKKSSSQVATLEEDFDQEVEILGQGFDSENYTLYTVTKDDTLQKISYKFYGTTRKWKVIYDNNVEAIKNPDRLYPGTKIKIPALE